MNTFWYESVLVRKRVGANTFWYESMLVGNERSCCADSEQDAVQMCFGTSDHWCKDAFTNTFDTRTSGAASVGATRLQLAKPFVLRAKKCANKLANPKT